MGFTCQASMLMACSEEIMAEVSDHSKSIARLEELMGDIHGLLQDIHRNQQASGHHDDEGDEGDEGNEGNEGNDQPVRCFGYDIALLNC
jgi:t-SNARE complex subunit (syntaxin)